MDDDAVNRKAVQQLAYRLWQERGRPTGSPDLDWFQAEEQLRRERSSSEMPLYAFSMEPDEP